MAKIPIILEAGRADGKLISSGAIFDENKGMFQSEINDIQDTLNSDNPNKPLSAKQGKVLKELLDTKVIETVANLIDSEPTEGNITHIVNSDGLAKEFNKCNTTIINTNRIANEAIVFSKLSVDIQNLITNLSKTTTFAGIATPTTNPGITNANVFYIANGKGIYTNFGGIQVIENEVVILYYDTAWNKIATGIASQEKLFELDKEVGSSASSYEQSALTLTGYINNEGRIIAGDNYRHSEHIPLAKGQTASVVGKTVAIGVHIFAAYNSDGELLDLFTHTGSYKLEEHTYTAISDGEYIIICSHTSQLADLSLSISAIGLKKEIFEIKEDSATIKRMIKAINGDIENLRESLQEESTIVNNIISQNVSQFYMNAWIRYDDGLISGSSGGAKLYIVNRDSIRNADKLYIHTCSQSTTFAAVAFYSSKIPSQETYLKDISIQGIKSSVGYDIEIDLTDGWQSALILNMSQLDANYSCVIKDSNFARKEELIDTLEKVEELEATIKNPTNKFFYEMSPFVEKPFIHHLNQENNSAIPAQSLLDISYAKRLGCNMIEINPHQCSDGVIVCKHGSGGALGVGLISADGKDYSNTQFSSVTSNWLRENISYAKVEGLRIPTLDEFCSVCKQESMMVRVGQNIDVNALNTIRKYLPDNMIYIDSFTSRANGTFRGIIGRIWNPSSKSIDNFLEDIKDVGKPLDVVIASGTFDSLSDEVLSHAVQECHKKGYTITMTYPNAERSIRALKFGIDTILSNNNLTNHVNFGNEKNVFIGDNDITLNGATMVDGKIQMPKASSIIIPCSKTIKNGVVSLRIRYAGTISSSCGASLGLNNHVSNGESFINLTLAIEDGTNWLHIVANENSVIYDMQVRCSRI